MGRSGVFAVWTDRLRGYMQRGYPPIVLVALSLIFFAPVLFQGKTFYAFDCLFDYLPWYSNAPEPQAHNPLITDPINVFYHQFHFVKRCFAEMVAVAWNPSNFCGKAESVPSHPVEFALYLVFPQLVAHDLNLWLHLLLAGLAMFFYLRTLGLGRAPCLIGGIAWMFNGYVMVWFEFENVVLVAATFPGSLLFFERWLKRRLIFDCICSSACLGLALCSEQHLVYQGLFLCAYVPFRYIPTVQSGLGFRSRWRKDLLTAGIAAVLLAGLSHELIPGARARLSGQSTQRTAFAFSELYQKTGRVCERYLFTTIFPDFFGSPAIDAPYLMPRDSGPQPYNNYNELCIYCGVLPLMLALCCIPGLLRDRMRLFFFLAAIVPLTMAMGSPLYYPLARFIPGLNLTSPSRILYLFGFSVSVLAALGADGLRAQRSRLTCWTTVAIVVSAFAAAVTIAGLVQTEPGIRWAAWSSFSRVCGWGIPALVVDHFRLTSPVILQPILLVIASCLAVLGALLSRSKRSKTAFLLLCVAIVSADLISFGLRYNTAAPRSFAYPMTDGLRFIKSDTSAYRIVTIGRFLHNSFASLGIEDAGGYSSFISRRYADFLRASGQETPERWITFSRFGSPLLDLINVKYLLLPPGATPNRPELRLRYSGEMDIYENLNAFPRAFFVPGQVYCTNAAQAYERIQSFSRDDFKTKVILESPPPVDHRSGLSDSGDYADAVSMKTYALNEMVVETQTNRSGFLVVSDIYAPDWQATIDGMPVGILPANYIMRAVPVSAGTHCIRFAYSPTGSTVRRVVTLSFWLLFVSYVFVYCAIGAMRSRPYR